MHVHAEKDPMHAFPEKNCTLTRVVNHVMEDLPKKKFSVTTIVPAEKNDDGYAKVELSIVKNGKIFNKFFFIVRANNGNRRRLVKRQLQVNEKVNLPSFTDSIIREVLAYT